jgi:predicted pyridoxine 5'-phosphate oxidase superfamily flavin-nucleotide-binding protein
MPSEELRRTARLVVRHGRGFLVEIQNGFIIVRVTGTSYAVMYHKPADSPQLLAKNFPLKDDHRAPMRVAGFLAAAWKLANDKARELGWIA